MNQIPEGWERGTHHAPVPWKADGCRIESAACYPPEPRMTRGCPLLVIYDEGGHTEADAEFICRAVNCHDEMLEALRMASVVIAQWQSVKGWERDRQQAMATVLAALNAVDPTPVSVESEATS